MVQPKFYKTSFFCFLGSLNLSCMQSFFKSIFLTQDKKVSESFFILRTRSSTWKKILSRNLSFLIFQKTTGRIPGNCIGSWRFDLKAT